MAPSVSNVDTRLKAEEKTLEMDSKGTRIAVKDLATIPSRSLYRIAASIQHVHATSLIIGSGHVRTPVLRSKSATQCALHQECLVQNVLEELVESSTHGDCQLSGTSKYLLGVALTCRDWFIPAMSALWSRFCNLPELVRLLLPDKLRGSQAGPMAQYRYIWETYYADPIRGRLQARFLIFRFYAGFIRVLTMKGSDFKTPVFSQLARLYDANVLFPVLRRVQWLNEMVFIPNLTLRAFGLISRAPLLSSLSLRLYNPSHDDAATDIARQRTCSLLQRAGNYAPNLTTLVIFGPSEIVVPVAYLATFTMVNQAEIHIGLEVPGSLTLPSPSEANRSGSFSPRTLLLSWSPTTELVSIIHVANFSNLRSLFLTADDNPPATFIKQVAKLGRYTTPSLVHLRVMVDAYFPVAIEGSNFAQLIEPFLGCSALESVAIELSSFSMPFLAEDFLHMLNAWRRLTSLEITFTLSDIDGLPDLRNVIDQASQICPHLVTLHLPAMATYREIDPHFDLQICSSRRRLYFSSDAIFLEHHPLDVAYHIMKAFGYNPIRRRKYIPGTSWTSVDTLVKAIKNGDRATVVRFGLVDWLFPWGNLVSETQDDCLAELENQRMTWSDSEFDGSQWDEPDGELTE